ncbi:MAG: MBL fold metallo-hydrolase [Candidatus Leucobacter sulfamidivorax]|nr:MBL fold metallo-hydrolase [Candidatus Leucobacter sulfamidivorax]
MPSELVQDRPEYTVRRMFVSEMNNAVYLLTAKASGEQILIDAADDAEALRALLADGAGDAARAGGLRWILTTHAHWDHTRATADLAAASGAPVVIGRDDAAQLQEERGVVADRELAGGERIAIEGLELEAIALRGHTPGSIAFATADGDPVLLFTGDSLFPGGVGNTRNDPQRFEQLFADVSERLFDRFGDDAIVYPGHGAETTLGAERPALPEWRERGW